MSNSPVLVLRALADGADHETIEVRTSPFRIGRRSDNQAVINRPDISGYHCELRWDGGGWWVHDERSTNGTFVNGVRVHGLMRLHEQDRVFFATRGYVVLPPEEEPVAFQTRVQNTGEVRAALELSRLINEQSTLPYFQSIVDLKTREEVGWESLGRAITMSGPMGAGQLLEIAVQNNVETKLSRAFRLAAQGCVECHYCWPEERRPFLFINLHPSEVASELFGQVLEEIAQAQASKLFQIVFEIPESWAAQSAEMEDRIKRIHDADILVAFDDFGVGQSRISDLTAAPPDFLKLDRNLVSQMGKDRVQSSIVKAIIDGCRDLNVRVIGEGIETIEECEACEERGIDLGQGFYFGRPLPAYELFHADRNALPTHCPFVRMGYISINAPANT